MSNPNSNPSVEKLESTISAYINSVYKDVPPTEEEFKEKADMMRISMSAIMPVSDQEYSEILKRLKQNLVIQMDVGIYINDRNNGHQSWLPSKRADFDFFFWNRYKKYLEEVKHWNPRVTANLGKVSDEILDLCGDPSEGSFLIKGLVLGDVQSGKTANYTAICNKAADTGYRIIIILAGIQEICGSRRRNDWMRNSLEGKASIISTRRRNRELKIPLLVLDGTVTIKKLLHLHP